MTPKAPTHAPDGRWRPPPSVFGRTYSLLRWSMPLLLLWLALAIAWAWITSDIDLPMTSISAYYYTDAQTVFVGVLISLGALLIIIQGRTPWEDALMNTAGALAPFVALLPTPVDDDDRCIAAYCTAKFLTDGIPDNSEIIEFNIVTVIPVWAILCAYLTRRAWTLRGQASNERRSSTFSAAATVLFGLLALGLWFSDTRRQVFLDSAHLVSAGLMVTLLITSMIPFARWIGPSTLPPFRGRPTGFDNGFWLVFWLTLALLAGWLVLLATWEGWDHQVLVLEIVAIVPFIVYWLLQGVALRRLDSAQPPEAELA